MIWLMIVSQVIERQFPFATFSLKYENLKLQIVTKTNLLSLSQIKTPYYAFSPSAESEKDKWEKK